METKIKNQKWQNGIPVITAILISILWFSHEPSESPLILEVHQIKTFKFLENTLLYVFLNVFTITFPVLLSFDKKVNYFTKWKLLFLPIALVGSFFIAWDVYFTYNNVWGFNTPYLSGIELFKLPLGEWLFFITVPFACVFIHECLKAYIKKDILKPLDRYISFILIAIFFIIAVINIDKIYTTTTFFLTASFISYHYLSFKNTFRTRFYLSYIISLIPFLLINGALTGSFTDQPVVIYNPDEFMGFRIFTIPLEDAVYSFLLLFSVIHLYEMRNRIVEKK